MHNVICVEPDTDLKVRATLLDMAQPTRLKVMVLYGGRSGEHEISLISAASVIRNLDPAKYEIIPVAIDKSGRWLLEDVSLIHKEKSKSLPIHSHMPEVTLPPRETREVVALTPGGKSQKIDVVFPVVHGPLCEDGTLQGLLELADIPYVGAGVLGSAVGMDKEVAKRLAESQGIPVVPYVTIRKGQWPSQSDQIKKQIAERFGQSGNPFPVFVKPVNMGSSVGVTKVREASKLSAAIEEAFQYDTKVLVEKAISAREIEFAVLEDRDPSRPPRVSVPGEIVPTHEFYSYEAKYLDENGAELLIPSKLTPGQMRTGQEIAARSFTALECEGMARVDLFLDKDSGEFYLNEINTIPGFTHISMFPKLWEASGIPYAKLLDEVIELARLRHERRKNLRREK